MTFAKSLSFAAPFVLALAFMGQNAQTYAGVVAAEEATKLLAKSMSMEDKCKFLSAAQHEELSGFVAKAEIAMVAKSSTEKAKALIATGRALGRSATCSDQDHEDVIDIIAAAQQASANLAQPAKPAATPVKSNPPAPVKPEAKKPVLVSVPTPVRGSLGQYAAMTEHYYKARRCNSMTFASISGLYKNVVATHHNVVASFGVSAVRAVMQKSETKANAARCS
jgi:hypothetical protein